jgi:hypothetical protein
LNVIKPIDVFTSVNAERIIAILENGSFNALWIIVATKQNVFALRPPPYKKISLLSGSAIIFNASSCLGCHSNFFSSGFAVCIFGSSSFEMFPLPFTAFATPLLLYQCPTGAAIQPRFITGCSQRQRTFFFFFLLRFTVKYS